MLHDIQKCAKKGRAIFSILDIAGYILIKVRQNRKADRRAIDSPKIEKMNLICLP